MLRDRINAALEKMVPTAQSCREAAEKLRQEHPGESSEQLARRAVGAARRTAAAAGAATGVVANPLMMIPAALADMAAVLRIEGMLAGSVAALLDPAGLSDESLRADVVSILFPGAVSQALRQVGIRVGERVGQRLTRGLIRQSLSKDASRVAMRMITRHLGVELTRKAILEKTAPLVGAGIGAGWNWLEVGVVGERALRYYAKAPAPLLIPRPRAFRLGDASPIRAVVKRVARRFGAAFVHSSNVAPSAPPSLPGPADL